MSVLILASGLQENLLCNIHVAFVIILNVQEEENFRVAFAHMPIFFHTT